MLSTEQLPCQKVKSLRASRFQAHFLLYWLRKNENQGFAWIQLLAILLVLGVLAAIALPSFLNQANKGKQAEGKQYISALNKAQQAYNTENGQFSQSETGEKVVVPQTSEPGQESSSEEYKRIDDNPFQSVATNPYSTFSIDVDTASYSNVRRFINEGQLPPKEAVRIEELVNYFTYEYPQPEGDRPFSIITEMAASPWNPNHKLVHIGLQGKTISNEDLPPSNLVFLLDVSGSMQDENKLPLLKSALRLLVNELTAKEKVSIVVYAGSAGVVLPPTPGNEKDKILAAIDRLEAGGSTAGGEGIQLAYNLAQKNFIPSGNNRVILATDGDFNVGVTSDSELVKLIEKYRDRNIFLTVLGFGMGNLKDSKMESLADKGNGNYAYIDNLMEAKKVLVTQMGGTLFSIAKDVKVQVEFNPAKVQSYRLIGYENRMLQSQDFNDDKKDAGELGTGHSVTALYEIIPIGVKSDVKLPKIDNLRYQKNTADASGDFNHELMLVKLRYKAPKSTNSQLITQPVVDRGVQLANASNNFKFSAAVAEFGMILKQSEYKGQANFDQVLNLANQSQDADLNGYRAEFIRLVQSSKNLAIAQSNNIQETSGNSFTNNFDQLGVGIRTETANYKYSIRVTERATFQYAIPKNPLQKGYIGVVVIVGSGNNQTSISMICEANTPGIKPPEPIFENGQFICAPGTSTLK